MVRVYRDSAGDGNMWCPGDLARWAGPAYKCGAYAIGTRIRVGSTAGKFTAQTGRELGLRGVWGAKVLGRRLASGRSVAAER